MPSKQPAAQNYLSLRAFSKLAEVSPTTISRYFAGDKRVSKDTGEHLRRLAEQYNFRPNPVARAAFGGRTSSIGLILNSLRTGYFCDIFLGAQAELLQTGFLPVTAECQGQSSEATLRAIRRLVDHRVDGILLTIGNESITQECFSEIIRPGLPIVLLDSAHPGFHWDVVATDDEMGGRLAAEHLLELGHRRMAYIGYGCGQSTSEPRLRGFQQALALKGIKLTPESLLHQDAFADNRTELLRRDIAALLERSDRPTAIFAGTDYLAREVLYVAQRKGLRIPHDLSLIGYADLDFAAYLMPALTTIRQNGQEVGKTAAELVLNRLKQSNLPPERKFLPVDLVVRESTAPAPKL